MTYLKINQSGLAVTILIRFTEDMIISLCAFYDDKSLQYLLLPFHFIFPGESFPPVKLLRRDLTVNKGKSDYLFNELSTQN